LALCQSGHQPLSEPAQAIKEILLELVAGLAGNLLLCDRAENREAS
jgi:LysR family nitrogen assimilation transcriptional regulator